MQFSFQFDDCVVVPRFDQIYWISLSECDDRYRKISNENVTVLVFFDGFL